MAYDLQIEDVSSIRRRLTFTVPQGDVKVELERAFKDLLAKVKLPGFRPGKVPRHVLEARFGRQVRSEVAGKLIERSYGEAAQSLSVAGNPAVEQRGEVEPNEAFTFTVAVDVRPEISVQNYKGLKVDYPFQPLGDEAIDAAVKRELSRRARYVEVDEPRPIQEGDFALTSVKLERDGAVLADEPGTLINTKGERYYPGVETFILGMVKDEEKTGEITIGASSAYSHLAGVTATATVKVLNVQVHTVPDLSDDLARELGYEGGADGMRVAITMKLQEGAEEAARNQARVDLLQKLVTGNPIEVPKGLVDEQFQLLVEEMRVRRAYSGQDVRSIRFSDAEIADLKDRAAFAAKASCLLVGVSKQEGIEVTEDDISAKIQEIADMRGQAVEAIRGYLEREGAMGMLSTRILEERVLDWLMENAELVNVTPGATRDIKDIQGDGDATQG